MLRVPVAQPAMGLSYLRHLDMPRVLGQAQGSRRAPVVRAVRHDGQMEGRRAREDESGRE